MRRTKPKLKVLLALVLSITAYQNCSGGGGTNKLTFESQSTIGGDGYDGKIYVRLGSCPDGSTVVAKTLVYPDQSAVVLRADCQSVPLPEQKMVTAKVDPSSAGALLVDGVSYQPTAANACLKNPVAVAPVVDAAAMSYAGQGNWINLGTGGSSYDFLTGSAANPAYPMFTSSALLPGGFLFAGQVTQPIVSGNTDFTRSLYRKGAKYTIVYEGSLPSGGTQVLVSNGSWGNTAGIALFWAGTGLYLQVGNGLSSSTNCTDGNSLCSPSADAGSASVPGAIFAAASIDESAGAGVLRANAAETKFNAAYRFDSTVAPGHDFMLSNEWSNWLESGARAYRVRVFDQALTSAQLKSLYAQSAGFCPW